MLHVQFKQNYERVFEFWVTKKTQWISEIEDWLCR